MNFIRTRFNAVATFTANYRDLWPFSATCCMKLHLRPISFTCTIISMKWNSVFVHVRTWLILEDIYNRWFYFGDLIKSSILVAQMTPLHEYQYDYSVYHKTTLISDQYGNN